MKASYARRYRRQPQVSNQGAAFFRKESGDPAFFDAAAPTSFFTPSTNTLHRKCDACEEENKTQVTQAPEKKKEEKTVQRKAVPASGPVASVQAVVGTLRSGGQTLPPSLNDHFSSRMGRDFGNTIIHTGSQAALSAKSIHAKAYTLGNHIVFAEGQYQPDSYEGKKLLAHELVHVAQQGHGKTGIYRMAATTDDPATEEAAAQEQPLNSETIATSGHGDLQYENKRDYANCAGVSVQGHTDANYSHSYDFSGSATRATDCGPCGASPCINDTGTIVSTFSANPSVTLPSVPPGLSECETNAVSAFINGTLSAHEQQHVAAFNTYAGTVRTPFTYHGCQSGEDAYVQGRHNAIEASRRAASNAASAALDPFSPTIPCQCPEPSSTSVVNPE